MHFHKSDSSGINQTSYINDFKNSLSKIESADHKGVRYKFIKNSRNDVILKQMNFWDSIKNWFSPTLFQSNQKALTSLFVAKALNYIESDSIDYKVKKQIRDVIINPIIKKVGGNLISEYLKPNNDIVTGFQNLDKLNEENLSINEKDIPLSEEHLSVIDNSIFKEEDLFLLKFENKEAITLFDAKPFVNYMYQMAISGKIPADYDYYARTYQSLKKYYADTHQKAGFEEIEVAARQSAFLKLVRDPAQFKQLNSLLFSSDSRHRTLYQNLCTEVIQDIDNKQRQHPSIHGHPRDLFNAVDKEILSALTNKNFYLKPSSPGLKNPPNIVTNYAPYLLRLLQGTLKKITTELSSYEELFSELHFINAQKLKNKPVSQLTSNEIQLILSAKNALMEIDLGAGRMVTLSLLMQDPLVPFEYRQGLKKLMILNDIRGPSIDQAMFTRFKSEHDQTPNHPRVAIEGGGPTGLLTAITQFRAGANVSLFEKRSTLYDRTQIVRVDPKWMTMLKFYLGEEYYKLFQDEGHKGVIRSDDGFGEIATAFLEESLHNRLTMLMSIIPNQPGKIPDIERLAAYEITDLKSTDKGEFLAVAKFEERYDPDNFIFPEESKAAPLNKTKPPQLTNRAIDMLICAGGKNSPLKEKFLPSSVAVNDAQNYGVCSWLSKPIVGRSDAKTTIFDGQDSEQFNMFQDFRGVVHLDQNFRNEFRKQLEQNFKADSLMEASLEKNLAEAVKEFISSNPSFKDFIQNGPQQPYVQTRTFENMGLVYIGMEIPSELKTAFSELERCLNASIDKYISQDLNNEIEFKDQVSSQALQMQKGMIIKYFQQIWFQNIAENYGLDKVHGVTMDKMDKNFIAMFPVQQNRLEHHHFFSEVRNGNRKLFIAAAGDSKNSPHFMRYSGLTGAREDILGLQKWTSSTAKGATPSEQYKVKKELVKQSERTAEFVISRGLAFLKPKQEFQIAQIRKQKIIDILEKEAESKTRFSPNYTFEKIDSNYFLVYKGKKHQVHPTSDGAIQIHYKTYESLEQIRLELSNKSSFLSYD